MIPSLAQRSPPLRLFVETARELALRKVAERSRRTANSSPAHRRRHVRQNGLDHVSVVSDAELIGHG
jgi:hypothetical protein